MLFPLKLEENIHYSTDQALALNHNDSPDFDNRIPYIFNNTAGYFSKDLKNSWQLKIKDGISILNDGYINYSREDELLNYRDITDNIKFSIEDDGYPFSIEERLFIISRNRKSISEVIYGEKAWHTDFNYTITSVGANKDKIVLGFVKGNFLVLDKKGNRIFNYEPGGSRIPIIYSVNISDNSQYLGVISGLDPQRFILYENRDDSYKPVYVLNLDDQMKHSSKIFFTSKNTSIFIERDSGFYTIDPKNRSSVFIEAPYKLKNVEYIPRFDLYMVHSGALNYNNISLYSTDYKVLLDKNFLGDGAYVTALDRSIYILLDGFVVKVDIEEGL